MSNERYHASGSDVEHGTVSAETSERSWGDWLGDLFHRFHPGALPAGVENDSEFRRAGVQDNHDGYQLAAWEEEAELRYKQDMEAALLDNFAEIDAYEFLGNPCNDLQGQPVILIVARYLPANVVDAEKIYRYTITKLDDIVNTPYSVVYIHTDSSYWENSPGALWLRSTYERLPVKYKRNLSSFYILHSDMSLWLSMSVICPFMSHGFWRKVHAVSRLEFLWDAIGKKHVNDFMPKFAKEHDEVLEEEPLHDFGFVSTTKDMPLPEAHLG